MSMVIWRDVPVKIRIKMSHVRKIGGRIYRSIITTWGDIPVAVFNEETKRWEPVENNRGYAYGARNRLKYRNKKREVRHVTQPS